MHIGGNTLFLRGAVREIFFDWLREHRPDLLPRYEELYARGAYVPADERRTIEVRRRRAVGAAPLRGPRRPPPHAQVGGRSTARESGEFGTSRISSGGRRRRSARSRARPAQEALV